MSNFFFTKYIWLPYLQPVSFFSKGVRAEEKRKQPKRKEASLKA